jgi:hypothetical protein
LPSWQKISPSGKSAVLPSLTNQALTRLIWQAAHGLRGSAELISASLVNPFRGPSAVLRVHLHVRLVAF